MDIDNNDDDIDEEELVISSSAMKAIVTVVDVYTRFGMLDSGSNIQLATYAFAVMCGRPIELEKHNRVIGTAEQEGSLPIFGWIDVGGYIGVMAVCKGAAFTLLSVSICQSRGLGCDFPPLGLKIDELWCQLYTINSAGIREELHELMLDEKMKLYFVDINSISDLKSIIYVKEAGDYIGPGALLGGNLGATSRLVDESDDEQSAVRTKGVVASDSIRKRKPTHDMCRRVWQLHENLGHSEMRNVAEQIKAGEGGVVDVEPWEINLVIAYQHCLSCAISKWKRYSDQPSSGVHEIIVGRSWSMDYQGPFATTAVGGFTGKFTCVELTTGLGVVYLVKAKDEAYEVVKRLAEYNSMWGRVMRLLRVDAGSVENSVQFGEVCASLNGRDKPGVEVRPAAVEKQNQNPVERHIQTIDNQINAILVGIDTLSARWWGWASIFAWKTRNHIRNKLCPDSSPIYQMEGKTTSFASFRFKFGQIVITRRIGVKKKHITSRNELGIVVCPVLFNGTVLLYLPERGRDFVAPRADVRALLVGSKEPTMSIEDGQKYMPALREDGTIGLVTRGDTGFLSQKYIIELDDSNQQSCESTDTNTATVSEDIYGSTADLDEYIHPSIFDSSIATDTVFKSLQSEEIKSGADKQLQADDDDNELQIGEHVIIPDVVRPLETAFSRKLQNHEVPESRSRRPIAKKPSRYANFVAAAYAAYNSVICGLLFIGTCMILNMKSPDTSPIMANATMLSPDEYNRRNPTWGQAMKGPDREKWLVADEKERKQHFETKKTFEYVPGGRSGVPRGQKVLPLKRHCKIKDDGTFKVRWVALGNLDDFTGDTFAPTISKKVVYLIFAVSLLLGLTMKWYDIGGAFMAEKPNRVVYVEIDKEVYILLKSLYGLTDAPKVFNDGLVAHLVKGGYIQSKWDQCLFVKWTSPTTYIYIVLHVDDFTGSATSQKLLDDLEEYLKAKYTEVTTNTDGMFLGIFCEKQADSSMKFTKPFQLLKIFEKHLPEGMTGPFPKDPMTKRYMDTFQDPSPPVESTKFRSLLGALMQLTDVRAEVVFPLSKIATRTEEPRESDYEALMHIVRFLYGTKDNGLCLRGGDKLSATTILKLRAYADCGFACHIDGKSQYGICFDVVPAVECVDELSPLQMFIKTGMFYCKSIKAPTVDLHTTEGECATVVEAVKDVILYRGIFVELHQTQIEPTPVYNDNKSTITLATKYSGMHKRIRYMLTKVNWLMEKSKEQVYKLLYLKSEDLPADHFTKLHVGEKRQQGADIVMGV